MVKIGAGKSSQKSVNISMGILYIFFSVYVFIFGFIISDFITIFQQNNPGALPLFMSYIPLLFWIGGIFLGFGFLVFVKNVRVPKSRETKSRKASTGSTYKQALFLIIFIFAFIPLFSPAIDQGRNDQYFSIYNNNWNGCSSMRQALKDEGYTVMNVQSSLSATDRINKSRLLVLMGPNEIYNPLFEIPYFIDFFGDEYHKNSMLICHDHGSTYELLWEIFIANLLNFNPTAPQIDIFPVTIFPNGILRDNQSCLENGGGLKDTSFPIIQSFPAVADPGMSAITTGISKVILSEATAAAGGDMLIQAFGWNIIGQTSQDYSFVDKNGNRKWDNDTDIIDLSFIADLVASSLGGSLGGVDMNNASQFFKLPLGGTLFRPAVFLAKQLSNSRVFVSSDASLFTNDLINEYDNLQFGINIVDWLTYAGVDNKDDWIIVFDESHIRPEYTRDLTSAGIFGFILQYIVHLSTNPITAWIYPLLAIYTFRKYLPKKDEDEEKRKAKEAEKKEEKEKFRTSSFFAQKIDWYKEKNRYGKALTLLYRRVERKLHAQIGGEKITTQKVIDWITAKEAGGKVSKLKIKRITKFMDRMIAIKAGKGKGSKVKTPEEFENLFLEMSWVMNNI